MDTQCLVIPVAAVLPNFLVGERLLLAPPASTAQTFEFPEKNELGSALHSTSSGDSSSSSTRRSGDCRYISRASLAWN